MVKTIINTNIEQQIVGYMLNAPIDLGGQKVISDIQARFVGRFGDVLWCTPSTTLHVTLFDWIAPLVDYGRDKDTLFAEIYPTYDKVVEEALDKIGPITINFTTVDVGPAAIFIVGQDEGQFESIRKHFLDRVTLLPNTKLPPTIIHSTIARFVKETELEPIQKFASGLSIDFTQTITSFRLVRETLDPMLAFKTLKEYQLK